MRCISWLLVGAAVGCSQGASREFVAEQGAESTSAVVTRPSVSADAGAEGAPIEGSSGSEERFDAGPPPCVAGPGTSATPRTIVEAVQLINGLPFPVTITCFLEALERPLKILAASSFISAQPAFNPDNPRIFIIGDKISLSVVPLGDSQNLLEMGELTSNTRSIKAELEFPIVEPLALDAAFEHIRSEVFEGTVCFGCHRDEVAVEDYPVAGAFDSIAYRPLPDYEVNFEYVKYQFTTCDASLEPERCAFYNALFAHGEVGPGRFPDEMPLFQ